MPKVHEEEGCQFFVYLNEHNPPHVHIRLGDGLVVLYLDETVSVWKTDNVKANEIRKARRVALANRAKLLQAWAKIHG